MCGNLKHSHWVTKSPITPGSFFPAETKILIRNNSQSLIGQQVIPSEQVRVKWNSFCKIEDYKLGKTSNNWRRGELVVESFTEKGREYNVPLGSAVQVLILKKENNYFVNILTREAVGLEERVNSRFPLVTKRQLKEI